MIFNVLITCNANTRDSVMEKIKEFKDVKNIQQRKDQNELLLEVESNDQSYVQNNVVKRMQDIQDVTNAALTSQHTTSQFFSY